MLLNTGATPSIDMEENAMPRMPSNLASRKVVPG